MAEDPRLTAENITRQYARYFFGATREELWTQALAGLEDNWRGTPGRSNTAIPHTLELLLRAVEGTPYTDDWRATMYLKRAYYDAFIQRRFVFEVEECEAEAWRQLATAATRGSKAAMADATAALSRTDSNASLAHFHSRVVELTAALNKTIGMEVLGNQDPSLNGERKSQQHA